jgi:hypothetical protein
MMKNFGGGMRDPFKDDPFFNRGFGAENMMESMRSGMDLGSGLQNGHFIK